MTTCGSNDPLRPACGCGARDTLPTPVPAAPVAAAWVVDTVRTAVGDIPRARTSLGLRDRLGALMVRSGIRRGRYRVPPGLYAVGSPTADSSVFVSANYKLSFDRLRSVLGGRDGWILVLDTKGINVWCAAGKGTFGTAELVARIGAARLAEIVRHRKLVLPQLGAPGVAAHEVREATGFRVVYGPVRAEDLPAFLDARMKATEEMRRVRFELRDRLVLVPVELVIGTRYSLPAAAAVLLLGGLSSRGYALQDVATTGLASSALVLGTFIAAQVLGLVFLPWLPGRAFSLKGAVLGAALVLSFVGFRAVHSGSVPSSLSVAAWLALASAISSFMVMDSAGTAIYTSLSGVLREMRYAVPAQLTGAGAGLALWLTGLFVGGGPTR